MDRVPKTGHPVVDALLMAWGAIYSALSWSALNVVETGVGITVGILTCVLLIFRILKVYMGIQEEVYESTGDDS